MRRACLALLLSLVVLSLGACFARHTYYVELTNGKYFYADPPLVLDTEQGVYYMNIAGVRQLVPMDQIRYLDDAAEICYRNGYADTDTFTCYGALYQW